MPHPGTDFSISPEELLGIPWLAVLAPGPRNSHHFYADQFCALSKSASDSGDEIGARVYHLLNIAMGFHLSPTVRGEPLTAFYSRTDGVTTVNVSPAPADLSEGQRRTLEAAAQVATCDEFKARTYDVLWVTERKYPFALEALQAYVHVGSDTSFPLDWREKLDRLRRARVLALQINEQATIAQLLSIEEALIENNKSNPDFPVSHFIGELLNFDVNSAAYAVSVENSATTADSSGDFHSAERHWSHASLWWKKQANRNQARQCLINAAESMVQMAESHMRKSPPQALYAVGGLERAIEAFRAIPGTKDRVIHLHRRLLGLQREIKDEFETITTSRIDIRGLVAHAEDMVRGFPLPDAILRFCAVTDIPAYQDLHSTAASALDHAPFSSLIGTAVVNQIGRVVARKEPLSRLGGATNEESLEAATYEQLRKAIDLYAAAGISPALEILSTEHQISRDNIADILRFSRFIPTGKLSIFVEGYFHFFSGNLFAAAHLIVPQIEPILRHLLESGGVIATQLKHDLVQDESTLNSLLDEPALVQILGDDIIFNLKGLSISRFGFNFRHRLAHGLMEPHEFSGGPIAFLLWLILRLCSHHLVVAYHDGLEKWERQASEKRLKATQEGAYFIWERRLREGIVRTAETDWLEAERTIQQEPLNCS